MTTVARFVAEHRVALALLGAAASAAMTVVWTVYAPEVAGGGWRRIGVRLGHPAAWAFLTAFFLLTAADIPGRLRAAAAWASLACYALFLAALLL